MIIFVKYLKLANNSVKNKLTVFGGLNCTTERFIMGTFVQERFLKYSNYC
jgi:hypothetical protein